MTKSTKIMISVIGAVLAVCITVTTGVSISKRSDANGNETTISAVGNSETTTMNYVVTETTAPVLSLGEKIIGQWTDSANMSGYKFYNDGMVEVTYVNLTVPVVNMPINGTAKGNYSLNGDELTVSFSIYSKTITKKYTASVENNILKLVDKEEGETGTYTRVSGSVTDTTASTPVNTTAPSVEVQQTGITGTWISGSGDVKYTLNENSTLTVTFSEAKLPSVSENNINGTYSGVYMTDESEKTITIQFTVQDKKVTEKYKYNLTNNALSLENDEGDTTIFVRQAAVMQSADAASLLGAWSDSADMSGYDFKDGGIVEITYVNFTVPVVNMPINGKYQGTYSVSGNTLTITSSIYSSTTVNTYTYSVENDVLTLISAEDGEISTYRRK